MLVRIMIAYCTLILLFNVKAVFWCLLYCARSTSGGKPFSATAAATAALMQRLCHSGKCLTRCTITVFYSSRFLAAKAGAFYRGVAHFLIKEDDKTWLLATVKSLSA